MALQYLLAPTFQFINTAGKPLSGGAYMEVYVHGTRTKYFCASDFDGTLHPFRIPLDSLGSNIVLANDTGSYDVYAYNRYGTLMMSRYNVKPGAGGGIGGTITSQDGSVKITPTADGVDLSVPEQQQSDWNEFRTDRPSYIRNKPNILLKADRVSGAVPGDLAGLDANGNLTDSGKKASDFKTKQAAVSDPTASGNTISFIDTISQDTNGVIAPTKKTVSLSSAVDSEAEDAAATPKAVKLAYEHADSVVSDLDAEVTSTDGTNVQVKVTQANGKIAGVNITTDSTESVNNKVSSFQAVPNDVHYPSEKLVKDSLDLKANKSEMTVTPGTGANADKTTIQLKTGTSATVLTAHQDITGKADKVSRATAGNFAGLDSNGNLVDSGKSYSDLEGAFKTRQTAKVSPTASGNTLSFIDTVSQDENGEITATKKTVTVDSTYSSAGTNPVNGKAVAAAIGTLDVKDISGFGAGKTLATLTETDGKVAATFQDIKITKSQVSDFPTEMTPSSHTHGNITNDGKIGTTADLGIVTGTGGTVTAKDFTKASPTTGPDTTTEFISTVAQGSDGAISATKQAITPASTSAAGIVQLSSSTSSSSETMAATPKAVKDAYDDLNNKIVARPIPTKDSDLTNDRYVRFDDNNQGLTDAQKSNARTNIGAGTSNLELGETAFTAAYGNHQHGRLQNNGSLGDENWSVTSGDRIVIAKAEFNGKRGYLAPSAITFNSDEGSKVLTQSAEWKEFLPPNGDGSSVSVTPDGTSTGYDLGSSTTLKVLAQKFKNLVNALKALAFKDKVTNSDISGTISDSHIASASTWNGKQNALATQTAYSAKGSATKVPQITTNSLGQVTEINEVTISGVTPSSHASTGTTYGVGTTANYGHVKLLNGDLNGKSYTDGVAAASAHTHGQYLTSQSITTGSSNGSIAVSGKDVAVKGLGSLAYKSAIGTGDVSSGTYGISISGTAAKATNDGNGDNIANQFTGVRQSLTGLQGTVDDILTDDYFFRGVRYYSPSRSLINHTPTLEGTMITEWSGYSSDNKRIYGQLNVIVCNLSSSGYWYDLQVRYIPIDGSDTTTLTWTKYSPPNSDGSNIIFMPLFKYTIQVWIYKNSNKNTGAFDVYRECILNTGVKEHAIQ